MESPIFSIIIPCYNQAHFLNDAVNSVLSQDFQDWEIIIVNDGSLDNTSEIATDLVIKEKRIKILNQENRGLSAARNTGLKISQGEFIHFLDADDWIFDGFYSTVKKQLEKGYDLLITGYCHVKDNLIIQKISKENNILGVDDFINGNYGPPVAFVLRRSFFKLIGEFDEELKSAEDWDLWLRVAKAGGKIKIIPDCLAAYRYFNNSMSRDAFRMYYSLKTVYIRGINYDDRIKTPSTFNKEYHLNNSKAIKRILLQCLGVSVMQGMIRESQILFETEKGEFQLNFSETDFTYMNSYLTFRYWNSKSDIEEVFTNIYPNFDSFFSNPFFSNFNQEWILKRIFLSSVKKKNRLKYGYIFGSFLNRFFI